MTPEHLVTHGLAVKKFADASAVAALLGEDPAEVEATLQKLVEEGKVISAKGAFMLKPDAGKALLDSYADAFAPLRANEAFVAAYERFELVNTELKQLVTDWQTMTVAGESVPNDHSNAEWDTQCIDRLGQLHERAEVVLNDMAAHLPRLATYTKRLEAALDRIDDGDTDYFSAPKKDSYHTVWFELHEDLLRMLGRTRDE